MIDLVRRFFGKSRDESQGDKEKDTAHDIQIATCALFLEMSNIDGEFSESERDSIMAVLKKDYGLSGEHTSALIDASHEELEKSIDLWRFTNLINQNYSLEEKIRIIEIIWHIVYADGKLNKHEDYLVHKLAKLLHLTHKHLIDAKLKAKTLQNIPV